MKFLIIGAGIGKHHAKNLKELGHGVEIFDIDPSLRTVDSTEGSYDGFLICTPPDSHLQYIEGAIDRGVHIFVEKPISDKVTPELERVVWIAREKGLVFQVGYNLRFSSLKDVKRLIDENTIGRMLCLRAEFGQWLPDWRPHRNYLDTYTAQCGVLLDAASHEIDYIRWILGKEPDYVSCCAGNYSDLNTPGEDMAEIMLEFDNMLMASIHVDYIQKGYTRKLKIIGTEGQIEWTYPKEITVVKKGHTDVTLVEYDSYKDEMVHFIKCIEDKSLLMDAVYAVKVLKIVETAKLSAKEHRRIKL